MMFINSQNPTNGRSYLTLAAIIMIFFAVSCSDEFLDRPPQGTYYEPSLSNEQGIEGILIGAYSSLNGRPGQIYGGASNWLWGSVGADEAYKGSEASDQADINFVEAFEVGPGNVTLKDKWIATFDGPDVMPNAGKINKWTAAAYLAKAMIFQGKYAEALPILKDIIENGTIATGTPLALNESFHDNFRIASQHNSEILFAIQSSVYDGAIGQNGNYENVLNYPHNAGSPGGCCGFFQPSQSLVNSYRTDENGLPFFDSFNAEDVINDAGVTSSGDFTPYEGRLDPRLDWTVGRRGIPYLDWGLHPGRNWIRQVTWGGPYSPKKNVFYQSEDGTLSQPGGWGQVTSALNIPVIRFADVILWAAEAEAEAGSKVEALRYVNMIRERAGNVVVTTSTGEPAANYHVEPYTSFPS
jgi:hypothetical protein